MVTAESTFTVRYFFSFLRKFSNFCTEFVNALGEPGTDDEDTDEDELMAF